MEITWRGHSDRKAISSIMVLDRSSTVASVAPFAGSICNANEPASRCATGHHCRVSSQAAICDYCSGFISGSDVCSSHVAPGESYGKSSGAIILLGVFSRGARRFAWSRDVGALDGEESRASSYCLYLELVDGRPADRPG